MSLRNNEKRLFTPGPGPLLPENLLGLRPCFGRNDRDYADVESSVVGQIRELVGLEHIISLQGSASLALEIACLNFLEGNVFVICDGYYGERLLKLTSLARSSGSPISSVNFGDEKALQDLSIEIDWLVSCVTETSKGRLWPIRTLREYADGFSSKLLLDATGSVGLEDGHEKADVVAFSSCKGLFGLTGASFVAFDSPPTNKVNSFYMDLETHVRKLVTGPYHSICSLVEVLPRHSQLRRGVEISKANFLNRFKDLLIEPLDRQPRLCTSVRTTFQAAEGTILYEPRSPIEGSIVCHLGEGHMFDRANGSLLSSLVEMT